MTALTSNDTAHKIQQGISYKQEGNAAFLQRDYVQALRSYHYATLVRTHVALMHTRAFTHICSI